jgi:hypothetical protein
VTFRAGKGFEAAHKGLMTDLKAPGERVDDLIRLEMIIDKYLTAMIGVHARGCGIGVEGVVFR